MVLAPSTEQKAERPGPQARQRLGELPAGRAAARLLPEIPAPTPRPAPGLTAAVSQARPGLAEAGGGSARFGGKPLLC